MAIRNRIRCLCVTAGVLLLSTGVAGAVEVQLHVTDEQGRAIPKFQAMLVDSDNDLIDWQSGTDGAVKLTSTWEPKGYIDIVVRADGFASSLARFEGSDRQKLLDGSATVTLARGTEVELHLNLPDGMTWPKDALPGIYFDACNELVWIMCQTGNRQYFPNYDSNLLNAKQTASGNFSFRIAPPQPPFNVLIHVPGFLSRFAAGPFITADVKDGVLSVDVPKPATLEVRFDPGPGAVADREFALPVYRLLMKVPTAHFSVVPLRDVPAEQPLMLHDLAPGTYTVDLDTQPASDRKPVPQGEFDPGTFSDWRRVTLSPAQTEKVDFHFVPFTPNAFHGDRTAVIQLNSSNGKPAAGQPVEVDYIDPHYKFVPVFTGPAPQNGQIKIPNMNAAPPVSISGLDPNPYSVWVDERHLGTFGFHGSDAVQQFEFLLPAKAGDLAPDIELQNLSDGKTVKLSDFRGKFVLIDFWATWCGPCQSALEKLDHEVADHADQWTDKLVILPISIDDDAKTARPHFANRGWTHLHTYWTGAPDKTGWKAPALRAFVSNYIPYGVLIDHDGKIIWLGNPANDENAKQLSTELEKALGP